MEILTAKYIGQDREIIEDFPDQVVFLNLILGGTSDTDAQLVSVKHYIGDGDSDMRDMISGAFLGGNLTGDEDDFQYKMRSTLLAIQFSLGEKPLVLRGAGSSSEL